MERIVNKPEYLLPRNHTLTTGAARVLLLNLAAEYEDVIANLIHQNRLLTDRVDELESISYNRQMGGYE